MTEPGTVASSQKTEVNKTENSPSKRVQSRVGETDVEQVSDLKDSIKGQAYLLCIGKSRKASVRS